MRAVWIVIVACGGPTTETDGGIEASTDASIDSIVLDSPVVDGDASRDRCGRPNKCPADPPDSPQQIASCKKNYNDCLADPSCEKCIDVSNAYTDCVYDHIVCGTDGKTDLQATSAAVNASCSTLFDAQKACFAG